MAANLQLLRPAQVAALLNVHRCTIWRWVSQGRFPAPLKMGTATGFRQSDVADWIDSRPASLPTATANAEAPVAG